jgi:hypothetical protein
MWNPREGNAMKVEEVAIWLYNKFCQHIIRKALFENKLRRAPWSTLDQESRDGWMKFAEEHKQIFHAGDSADT